MKPVSFDLKLYDDESVRKKLEVMTALEAAFDDERNKVPDEYYQAVDLSPGQSIRITIERIDNDKKVP